MRDNRRTRRVEFLFRPGQRAVWLLPITGFFGVLKYFESRNRGAETLLKILPSKLSVGHYGNTDGFLSLDGFPYRLILADAKFVVTDFAKPMLSGKLPQQMGGDQASDLINAKFTELFNSCGQTGNSDFGLGTRGP